MVVFAGASVADDGNRLSRLDGESDVAQNPIRLGGFCRAALDRTQRLPPFVGARAGSAALPVVPAAACRPAPRDTQTTHGQTRFCPGPSGSFVTAASVISTCIQQLENTLGRRHRRLQNVVLLAQVLNGSEKPLRILDKRNRTPSVSACCAPNEEPAASWSSNPSTT